MNTYLFAWNPEKWKWTNIEKSIEELKIKGSLIERWSSNSKKIKIGDRAFLTRLGREPKGIIGSGYIKSNVYLDKHWNKSIDKNINYVDIEFDVLLNSERDMILSNEALNTLSYDIKQVWSPRQSGIRIKKEIELNLEKLWLNFLNENNLIHRQFVMNEEEYTEGRTYEVKMTKYERNRAARQKCLDNCGYSCTVCEFNFEEYFGELGKNYIHVHHLNPLSEIGKEYKLNPLIDLVPVCPNCHAMIHRKKVAISIEKMKLIRKKKTTHNKL